MKATATPIAEVRYRLLQADAAFGKALDEVKGAADALALCDVHLAAALKTVLYDVDSARRRAGNVLKLTGAGR